MPRGRRNARMVHIPTPIEDRAMSRSDRSRPVVEVRRIVACSRCGGRRRRLVESAGQLRGLCIGCGVEVPFPLDTEQTPVVLGRGGEIVAVA
jgi:hypothetical protein